MRVFVSRLLSVSGLFIIINALYYVYQLVLNHGLTVSLYGGMSSIIAWTVLASLPAIALSVFLTRYVTLYSDDSTRRDTFIRAVFVRVVRAMIYLTPPIVLLGIWIAPYMSLSWGGYIAILATVIATIILGFFRSIAYVDGRLRIYMLSTIFEIGSRIIVTYILLMYTSDIGVLYGVYFLSIVSALTFFVSDMRTMLDSRGEWNFSVDEARDMRRQVLPMVLMSCFLISIGSIELVLARRILGNEDLGYFSALIMLSKLVLAGLGIWTSVGMAYFADMSKHRMLLALIYGGFVASVMIGIAVFVVAGEWMVALLFPPNYSVIMPYVLPMVAIACIISVTSLLIQHAVIAGQKMAGYLSIIIPISVIITLVFSDHTLSAVVYATLWGYSAGAGMWLFLFLLSLLRETRVRKEGTSRE